jgi:hypothetical protein
MSGRHVGASPDCVSAGGLLGTEVLTRFFRATDTATYIVPVASCHTLSLFVPMHTLAHNVMWRHFAGRCVMYVTVIGRSGLPAYPRKSRTENQV